MPALLALADAVGRTTTLSEIFEAALDGIREALGISRASILLFDPDGVMRFTAWRGLSDDYRRAVEGHTPWRPGEPAPAPVLVPDVTQDPALAAYGPLFAREEIAAIAFVPLLSQRRVIGKFMLYCDTPHTFATADVDIALIIGHQIGFAVERTRAALELGEVRDRLTTLTTGAQALLIARSSDAVSSQVLSLAADAVAADGYAVWRNDHGAWRVAASHGLSREFTDSLAEGPAGYRFDGPIVAEDVRQVTALDSRRRAYEGEGIRSLVGVPLLVGGEAMGGVAFYYRTSHRPSDVELRVAVALGHLAAAAIANGELHEWQQRMRAEAQDAARRSAFLAEASVVLSSLDYEANLRQVAELAVPTLADWCAVDLLDRGALRRLAVTHADSQKVALAEAFHARYGPRLDDEQGVARVLRTGRAELYPDITDEMLAAGARDDEHLRWLQSLEVRSAMVVPLTVGLQTFGALTFVGARARRAYDEADLEFARELARRAAYAIENARLFREAQAANRLKDEFLATLSHELRTPLNVILGRAQMLDRAAGDPARIEGISAAIQKNGATLARLVDDLLDLSRITLGQLRIDSAAVQLADVVDAAAQGVQPAAAAKGVALEVQVEPGLPPLRGDATRLQQIAWNLLVNALKFTPAGGRIVAALTREPQRLVLQVRDTGEGIDPEFLPFVFDMFRQGDAGAQRVHGGLGLGLSIVRQLVELHGGTVTAESEGPGRGATFTVGFPCVAAPDAGPAGAPQAREASV